MVLLGTKSTHLASVKAPDRYCIGCEKYDTLVLNVFSKQIHLCGIPILPVHKTGNAFCQYCKKVVEEEQMSELIQHEYQIVKNDIKRTSWQLSGGIFLLGAALALSLVNKRTNHVELRYLAAPQKGDIYEYKTDDTQFSTMKISRVSADSLYLLLNRHKIAQASGLYWIDKAENYQKSTIAFERQKINDMYNDGQILEINRKAQ